MSWSTAISEVFEAINKGLSRYWGTQTKEMDKLEAQAEHAAVEKRKALDAHPPDVHTASYWDRELKRLHQEITAKRG